MPDCHDEDNCEGCQSLEDYNPCHVEADAHNNLLRQIGEIDVPEAKRILYVGKAGEEALQHEKLAVAQRIRLAVIEECARVADHQKTICGSSMSRQSTCDDIAFNIRNLGLSAVCKSDAEKRRYEKQLETTIEMLKGNHEK